MGRTPKPLTILVHPALARAAEIKKLAEKGHNITEIDTSCTGGVSLADYDLVLGPNCWRMDESMLDYLELAIKGARTIKYPKKERSEQTNAVRPASVGGENESQVSG